MRAAIRQVLFSQIPFTPRRLFANGEQGAWFDPSDFGSMFQDSAGTTPVTAIEQPVGLILDKSGRGNHASQSTTTSRPILRNLYNLFQYTEQFSQPYWSNNARITPNTAVAPDGTTTADTLTSNGIISFISASVSSTTSALYSLSISLKYTNNRWIYLQLSDAGITHRARVWFDIQNGVKGTSQVTGSTVIDSYSIKPQGDGWYHCTLTASNPITTLYSYFPTLVVGDGSLSVAVNLQSCYLWGASLVPANESSLPYQRVVTNTLGTGVYDTDLTKFKPYLFFDGTDDWLATGNIDFSATDKVSVFAGIRKLSDAAQNVVAELSASIASNNGAFLLSAPLSAASNYSFSTRGTSRVDNTVTTYAAPITNIVTGLADIAAPINTIRVNQVATTLATSQGTGNFGNYPLYIGMRGGTTLPLNGRIYSLIIRGALTSTPQLEQTERWIAAKTGVAL